MSTATRLSTQSRSPKSIETRKPARSATRRPASSGSAPFATTSFSSPSSQAFWSRYSKPSGRRRARRDERLHELRVATARGNDQCAVAAAIRRVDIRACRDERLHNLYVAVA